MSNRIETQEPSMNKNSNSYNNNFTIYNDVSVILKDIEETNLSDLKRIKESKEMKLLKERCCSDNVTVSIAALQGIFNLAEKEVIPSSQTVSMLISLLPFVKHCNALISTIGEIVMKDFKKQLTKNKVYHCSDDFRKMSHPFILILKYSWENTWFDIYFFIQNLLQTFENISIDWKLKLVKPVFHYVFWNPQLKGSQFQIKLFNLLLNEFNNKKVICLALEILSWLEIDIYYCLFLQDVFVCLLNNGYCESQLILSALTPMLAEAIKWLILNGYNSTSFTILLSKSIKIDPAPQSLVLYILADTIMKTPLLHAENLLIICKNIIKSNFCNKYISFQLKAVALNLIANLSCLPFQIYKLLEDLLLLLEEMETKETNRYNDCSFKLLNNEYFNMYGSINNNINLSFNLILISNLWIEKKELVLSWLMNITKSNSIESLSRFHMFINGIILCENDKLIIDNCLNILMALGNCNNYILHSFLPILFYKLGKETDPKMQYYYLSTLPKLGIEKSNIPLIISIIESLEKKDPKMTSIIIQLYLSLWKFDKRIYSCLHKVLHESSRNESTWEVNVSKAKALKEICKSAPHLYAKDLISVLSKILNESSNIESGLPTAIIIDAVTELCRTYIIDIFGTWNTLRPKLQNDRRPEVMISLCKFFSEIPQLNTIAKKSDQLILEVVPILWNYTFFDNVKVVENAFYALSKFKIETLDFKFLPELYKINFKMPKQSLQPQTLSSELYSVENTIPSYIPADCWLEFLGKIDKRFIRSGGELIITLIERELNSLPRGIFYLPPEKSEPMTYSYLPTNSICRKLVEYLKKHASSFSQSPSECLYLKEIVRIISHEYSKRLPPLDWYFMSEFMKIDAEFLSLTLTLLTTQGSVSISAKAMLEDYLKEDNWSEEKINVVLVLSGKLFCITKTISFNIFQIFIKKIINLCLEFDLKYDGNNLFKVLMKNLGEGIKNKNISVQHKMFIAKSLENVLAFIPPKHEVMKIYALCATELPMTSIENISSKKSLREIDNDWLHRAIIIRSTIAMRAEIKNPLMWLNELIDAAGCFPEEYSFMTSIVLCIIRSRRGCNFVEWYDELMKTIQQNIFNYKILKSKEVILFFVDILITSTIALSGCDCLFNELNDVMNNNDKKLFIFPQSLSILFSTTEWIGILPKISVWLQHLLKWKDLPEIYASVFTKSILSLKNVNESTLNFYLNL